MKKDIYTNCVLLSVGCKVFLDEGGEVIAPAGKYSDGLVCYTVNAFGTITELNQCGGTTSTTTSTSTTSTSTSTTSTTTSGTTTTTLNPAVWSNGQYSSLLFISGSGQAYWKQAGVNDNPCASGSWYNGPVVSIGGSGQTSYTVYTGSVELVSGVYRNEIINGVAVPGVIFTPINSGYECGQSPLFVQKVFAGTNTTSSLTIFPNTSIPMAAGDKLQYWVRTDAPLSTARTNPPDSAIIGSSVSYTTFTVPPYIFRHVWATQTFTSSGNFYYNTF